MKKILFLLLMTSTLSAQIFISDEYSTRLMSEREYSSPEISTTIITVTEKVIMISDSGGYKVYAISDVEHKKYEYTEYHATLIAKQNFYNIALRITSDKMFLTIPGKFYVLKLNKVWP